MGSEIDKDVEDVTRELPNGHQIAEETVRTVVKAARRAFLRRLGVVDFYLIDMVEKLENATGHHEDAERLVSRLPDVCENCGRPTRNNVSLKYGNTWYLECQSCYRAL